MSEETTTLRAGDAAAGALALMVAANGVVDQRELRTLDQLRAFERLDIDRERFVELAHQYVREWSAVAAERRWLSPADLDYIGRRLAPVRDPQQRLLVCRLAAAIITADGRVSDPERLVYRHALGRWNISHAMVTQAILADARTH
jgi:uncharacterized tellurite resistance protein B-like protein